MSTKAQTDSSVCINCPIHDKVALIKLGVDMAGFDFVVALSGNPNTGKSTVFNDLTGLHQHTGNWPGKTVTRAEGAFEYHGDKYKLVDLPGTYSLLAASLDEEVARDFILFGQPDVTVVVVDATQLERNLNLVLQVLEITNRGVVALNMMDDARRHGLAIDNRKLAKDLGVPVVPMVARRKEGVPELLKAISEVAKGVTFSKLYRVKYKSPELEKAVSQLTLQIQAAFPKLPNARWVALRLLDGDKRIAEAFLKGEIGNIPQGDLTSQGDQLKT